jgi:IS1 family transposase
LDLCGKKANKLWLVYTYRRETGEIVTYVMEDGWRGDGKQRSIKTVEKLMEKLKSLGAGYGSIAVDTWESFTASFKEDEYLAGK